MKINIPVEGELFSYQVYSASCWGEGYILTEFVLNGVEYLVLNTRTVGGTKGAKEISELVFAKKIDNEDGDDDDLWEMTLQGEKLTVHITPIVTMKQRKQFATMLGSASIGAKNKAK